RLYGRHRGRLAAFAGTEPRFFRVFASPVKLYVFRSGETSRTRGAAVNTRRFDGVIKLRLAIASYHGGPTRIVFRDRCELCIFRRSEERRVGKEWRYRRPTY